jgi:lysophospholipid acyltransferase (LPLAT)-like uncharacterized protein
MPYRVDNIPHLLQPLFFLYSYAAASFMYFLQLFLCATCKIEKVGEDHPSPHKNHIYATWHENLLPYFVVYRKYKEPYAWINHPLWFMKPVHIALRWMGMKKLFLGSSGHGGKEAMLNVVEHLKQGYNTMINPDGPAGPYKELKPGVLNMSRLSGIPIVPVQFELSNYFRLKGWDKKKVPLPFSRIRVIYGQPFSASDKNIQQVSVKIQSELG